MEDLEVLEDISPNTQGRRWMLTINNPVETDEEFENYLNGLEHIKYSIFSREKGEIEGTIHFQAFLIFTIGKRFSTIKNYFPKAHIEQARGTNLQCREYCSKKETHISGPYENGQFAEERARTDKQGFLQMACAGLSDKEIRDLYPSLYLDKYKEIPSIYRRNLKEQFKNKFRDVEVTYIYGPSRSGKTSYIYNKYQSSEFYRVTIYNNSAFDDYKDEDVIVFDEFNSSFKITDMNHYLDRYYIPLPARYDNRFSMYTKVYIISNLPLSKQYVDDQERRPEIYDAFVKRINNIVRIDETGFHYEKQKNKFVQEEMEVIKEDGDMPF